MEEFYQLPHELPAALCDLDRRGLEQDHVRLHANGARLHPRQDVRHKYRPSLLPVFHSDRDAHHAQPFYPRHHSVVLKVLHRGGQSTFKIRGGLRRLQKRMEDGDWSLPMRQDQSQACGQVPTEAPHPHSPES